MEKFIKEIVPYIIIIIVVVLIRSFIITPVEVDGASMENTLHDGELLLLSKISYKVSDIKRFDIVVINKGNDKVVKRVIGLPGDKVEYIDNKLYINDAEVKDIYAKNATEDFDIKDICMVKEDRNFSEIDNEKANVLVDTLYEYSVLVFNIYNKAVA